MFPGKQKKRVQVKCIKDKHACDALMSGYNVDKCFVVFPRAAAFPVQTGDDLVMEIQSVEEGLSRYGGTVARTWGKQGEICLLKDVLLLERLDRRSAPRFSVNIQAEFGDLKDEDTGKSLYQGLIINLSKTGLLLAASIPLSLERVIVMMFDLDWDEIEVPVGVVGTVVREQTPVPGTGPEGYDYFYGVKFNSPRMAV